MLNGLLVERLRPYVLVSAGLAFSLAVLTWGCDEAGSEQVDAGASEQVGAGACVGPGRPCDATVRCASWTCTCDDGTIADVAGVCTNAGTCDHSGLGIDGATCSLFCASRGSVGISASTRFDECL